MTKKEIVKRISDRSGLTQLKTKEIVQWTFDAIIETLITEKRIELRNFGVFEVKRREARKARNPRTGDPVEVGPKNVVTFQPGKEMEEQVRVMELVPEKPRKMRKKAAAAGGGVSVRVRGSHRRRFGRRRARRVAGAGRRGRLGKRQRQRRRRRPRDARCHQEAQGEERSVTRGFGQGPTREMRIRKPGKQERAQLARSLHPAFLFALASRRTVMVAAPS